MSIQSNNKGLYLYGIIPKKNKIKLAQLGMNKEKIFTIEYKDLLAIVSESPYKVYDLSEENLLIHEHILRKIMEKSDVLPFNFGNVLKSKKELFKFLDGTYIHMLKMLRKVSDKIEVGLKVFIKNEYFNDEIETDEIKKFKKQIEGMNEKQAHLIKVDLGKMVEKSLEQKRKEYEEKIFGFLKQYCKYAKANDCSTVKMILNAAYLVDKDKKAIFDEKVNEICSKYDEKFNFKYSGPWPPYNFIEMPR